MGSILSADFLLFSLSQEILYMANHALNYQILISLGLGQCHSDIYLHA
jgi:hypothetical protein